MFFWRFFVNFWFFKPLKIMLPSRRNANFCKIDVFALSSKVDEKIIEFWIPKSRKINKNVLKNVFGTRLFVNIDFWWFWPPFWLPSWRPKKWYLLLLGHIFGKTWPEWPQERPKSGPRGPKSVLRAPQEVPRATQERPKASQERFKTPQDHSKSAPRTSKLLRGNID